MGNQSSRRTIKRHQIRRTAKHDLFLIFCPANGTYVKKINIMDKMGQRQNHPFQPKRPLGWSIFRFSSCRHMTRRRWWWRRRRRKTRHNGLECIVCVNIVGPCHIILKLLLSRPTSSGSTVTLRICKTGERPCRVPKKGPKRRASISGISTQYLF